MYVYTYIYVYIYRNGRVTQRTKKLYIHRGGSAAMDEAENWAYWELSRAARVAYDR